MAPIATRIVSPLRRSIPRSLPISQLLIDLCSRMRVGLGVVASGRVGGLASPGQLDCGGGWEGWLGFVLGDTDAKRQLSSSVAPAAASLVAAAVAPINRSVPAPCSDEEKLDFATSIQKSKAFGTTRSP